MESVKNIFWNFVSILEICFVSNKQDNCEKKLF